MNTNLLRVHQALQALDLTEDSSEAVQIVSDVIQSIIAGASVNLWRTDQGNIADAPTLVTEALDMQEPRGDDSGCEVAVPLIANKLCMGALHVASPEPLTEACMGLVVSQAQCAAMALDRLSWPASPLVFRQIVENANVPIDVADLGGKITYANEAAVRMYGYTAPGELIGMNVSDLYTNGDDERVRQQLDNGRVLNDGWSGMVMQRTADDKQIPVEL